jgi:hypothetical protein
MPTSSPGRIVMKRTFALLLTALVVATGCNEDKSTKTATATTTGAAESKEAEIQANLAKLSPEDRMLAEQQKYCATEPENRLGSMGPPIKITVKGEPVFICCKGCEKTAQKDPDKTLQSVKELKEKAAKEAH